MSKDNSFQSGEITFDYDYLTHINPHHDLVQQAVADAIKEYSEINQDRKLSALEIGTGTGITAKLVLQTVPNLNLVCVDISENMLKQAERKFRDASLLERVLIKNVSIFDELDKNNTPNNTYDVIFSAYTLHNLKQGQRERILPEIYRVLKPNGIFVLSDKIAVDNLQQHKENVAWYLDAVERFLPAEKTQAKKELVDHTYFDEQDEIKWTQSQFLKDMSAAGFNSIEQLYREKMEAGFMAVKQ